MATFQERIEDYIGTVDDTSGLDQFVKDAAQEVMSQMSTDLLAKYASRSLMTSSAGLSVRGKRILSVTRRFDDQQITAREISPGEAWKATNAQSLFLATNRSPVFWLQTTATDTRLFVKPDPASTAEADVALVAYPAPDASADSSATGLPAVAEDAVVLAAARRVLQKRMADYLAEDDLEHAQLQEREIDRIESLFSRQMERLKEAQ